MIIITSFSANFLELFLKKSIQKFQNQSKRICKNKDQKQKQKKKKREVKNYEHG